MGQQANITVYDGALTPVAHTLIGEGVERLPDGTLKASWKESLAGVPDYAQIRVSMTKRKLPSGVWRVTSRVEVPVMETPADGVVASGYIAPPKVAYVDTCELVGYFHERSVIAGRRSARQIALNLGGDISSSVAPDTSGPVPDLFDQLIQLT